MGSLLLQEVVSILRRGFNDTDPRVGSARDNSTSTSALRVPTGSNSSSFATLFAAFVPVSIYAVLCLVFFLFFRPRWPRVYAPRSFLSCLEPHERSEPLPSGLFKWFKTFCRTPDLAVLHQSSLDGYLFLRYLKILCVICGVGTLITWPILLPLHRYGGAGNEQLDLLTFGNISHPRWYYVHAFLAWIFFGFVLYMISRECVYFINLRQAYLLSPYYANRLSSRTVLFTCVPQQILDEHKLRKVFGDSAKNIWIPREMEDLDQLVREREQTASRLEKAEIELIKKTNEAYQRAKKLGSPELDQERLHDTKDGKTSPTRSEPVSYSTPAQHEVEMNILESRSTKTRPSPSKEPQVTITECAPSSATPSSPQYLRSDSSPVYEGPPADLNGSVAAQWIPYSARPVHRPLANFGRRIDTIKWTRNQLRDLAPKISKMRKHLKKGTSRPVPAVIIEFDSQVNAQAAYQTLAHHRANHMAPEIVGLRPQEIVWRSLRMHWWERILRRFAVQAFVAVMVIFWSIPAALVGFISNISFLENLVFLHWVSKLPKVVLDLISGLLPAVALSLLMALVPIIMRVCARASGVPTLSRIELFTQNAYFVFQVVQVFLVTTLTSAVSGSITSILKDPESATTLLSQNLPKASNFYVSYFILQGLAMSATRLVQMISVWRLQFTANAGDNPRLRWKRYHRLRYIHWGAVYPVFTNMGVIALSYAMIAPIILGFATIGLFIIYITYRYNLLYVYSSENDTRGLHYPRALKQTITGVYLAELCMIGLFALGKALGPLVLMFGLVIFTGLVHTSLSDALSPLMFNLPRTLAVEEELRRSGYDGLESIDDKQETDVEAAEQQNAYDDEFDPSAPQGPPGQLGAIGRSLEGGEQLVKLSATGLKSYLFTKYLDSPLPSLLEKGDFWSYWLMPDPNIKPNIFIKWLHPEIYADYAVLRKTIPSWPEITYDEAVVRDAYYPPSMRARPPALWIPKDDAGVSSQEVAHSGVVVGIRDDGAWLDSKGMVSVDMDLDRREVWERMRF